MNCIVCAGSSKQIFSASGDCVQDALEKIKRHYLFFKNGYDDKLNKLQELQKRNTKLMRAVELLQREQSKQRKIDAKRLKNNSIIATESHIITDDDDDDISQADADETGSAASKLNMALNSEQLFDSSALMSPNKNESIANTEKVHSPRILNITSSCTASRTVENKLKMETTKENQCPKVNEISKQQIAGAIRKPDWLHKQSSSPISTSGISRFMKPQRVDHFAHAKSEREMVSLSLNKNRKRKLKQKRLQLDVVRDSRPEKDTTNCDEVVDMSPNSNASIHRSKTMRSWMLRNDSGSSNKTAASISHIKHHLDDDCKDALSNSKDKLESSVESSKIENEFEMRLNDTDIIADGTSNNCETAVNNSILPRPLCDKNSDSSSVVILTQPSQDVIFLDDTTHYETDMLQDLMECDNNIHLENLKRIESKKIKELQKQATDLDVKQSKEQMQIKTEKKSEALSMDEQAELDKIIANEFKDESEEFVVRPIIVKDEPKKLSIKERFNIDCRDCENYIAFLGNNLTDEEIKTHLSKCTRHKEHDALLNQTPDGFWNPLMQSFAADDPRNEVLVDKRFVGKKRVGKYGSFI